MTALAAGARDAPRFPIDGQVARRLLRFELERLCTGVRHEAIAGWFGVSRPAASAAIACRRSLLSLPALQVLCTRLGSEHRLARLTTLLGIARRGKAGAGSPVDADLATGLEAFACRIVVVDPWTVPPSLRTGATASPLLDEADPVDYRWITSEHALRHQDVTAAHLAVMAERGNVDVRLIPAAELPHTTPFHVIDDVVVEPGRLAYRYAADPGTVARFELLVDDLVRRAEPWARPAR